MGEPGSGKSWSSLSIANMISPNFSVEDVVMDPLEFLKKIKDKKWSQGDCVIFDEAGVGINAKKYLTVVNRAVADILETFRRRNIGVIFTCPSRANLDKDARRLLHSLLWTRKIDYQKQIGAVKWYRLDYNPNMDKIYKHKFKIRGNTTLPQKIDRIWIQKPPKELIKDYERKRNGFQDDLGKEKWGDIVEKKKENKKKEQLKCNKCGYKWTPKTENPAQCPKCSSRKWDKKTDERDNSS